MPILIENLSVWDISFRLAGYDPRKFYFRIPLEVADHFRNLMDAILKGELTCETITLEKREFDPDEKMFSIYHWLDDIYACIGGRYYNRKLLRWAHIERFDFMLWCERMNIPLPEFWFPPGWNLEYDLPEGDIHPGYWYELQHWPPEERAAWFKEQKERATNASKGGVPSNESSENLSLDAPLSSSTSSIVDAAEKMRPNQEARIACQQIAKAIWKKEPDRTIASVVKDDLIQIYGGGSPFVPETVREWVRVVAPPHVRDRRGAPRKNRPKEQ